MSFLVFMVLIVQCLSKDCSIPSAVPSAAVTNHHKLSGRSQFRISHGSGDQKSITAFTGVKSRCRQGCVPSGWSRTVCFFGFRLHPLACSPFLYLQSQQHLQASLTLMLRLPSTLVVTTDRPGQSRKISPSEDLYLSHLYKLPLVT